LHLALVAREDCCKQGVQQEVQAQEKVGDEEEREGRVRVHCWQHDVREVRGCQQDYHLVKGDWKRVEVLVALQSALEQSVCSHREERDKEENREDDRHGVMCVLQYLDKGVANRSEEDQDYHGLCEIRQVWVLAGTDCVDFVHDAQD
jgi:hypothetical protein